jgi:hypothetical protein
VHAPSRARRLLVPAVSCADAAPSSLGDDVGARRTTGATPASAATCRVCG